VPLGAADTTTPYSTTWTPTASGTYSVTAEATDNSGNVRTSAAIGVTVTANGAPTIAIISPAAGATASAGAAVSLSSSAADVDGAVTGVRYFVNGNVVGSLATTAPYTIAWTPTATGSYTIVAEATDNSGNITNSAARTISVLANQAPVVAVTAPSTGSATTTGIPVGLAATASDSDGTITQVRFLVNGVALGATLTAAPYAGTWNPSGAGAYSIVAEATDSAGNITTSAAVVVTVVGNLAPTIALTSPTSGTVIRVGSSNTLAATANDSDGNIVSVQFYVNGLAQGPAVTAFPYRTVWTPNAEGVYRLTATATDNAGSTANAAASSVLVTGAVNTGDTVASGIIIGPGESGSFTAINARGKTVTLIGVTTVNGVSKTYFFSGVTVNVNGSFNIADALGRPSLAGTFTDTGAFGTLENGRVSFSGAVAFAGAVATVAPGYYSGNITGRMNSTVAAIVGPDGSIAIYVADGTFNAASFGAVDATGAFSLIANGVVRITGKADPATGFLTATITGGTGGTIMAATSAGVSFSDGVLRNLSTRGQVGVNERMLIAGFAVGGASPKRVLVRAVGPTLGAVAPSLAASILTNPQIQLLNSSNVLVAQNDDWSLPIGPGMADAVGISAASATVGAFPLGTNSRDSAILMNLPPGNYTAQVSGVSGGTGIALVEAWDVDSPAPFSAQKVMNISTRGQVGTNISQLIAGFVVSGNTAKKVLIRGVGPSLGVVAPSLASGVLADPILQLVRGADTVVRENDNWEVGNDAAQVIEVSAKLGAFPLTRGSKDAVILINLPPGTYTAQVTGTGTTTGLAIVEVYEVP
jgi:hypothetical protein